MILHHRTVMLRIAPFVTGPEQQKTQAWMPASVNQELRNGYAAKSDLAIIDNTGVCDWELRLAPTIMVSPRTLENGRILSVRTIIVRIARRVMVYLPNEPNELHKLLGLILPIKQPEGSVSYDWEDVNPQFAKYGASFCLNWQKLLRTPCCLIRIRSAFTQCGYIRYRR